MRKKGNKSYFAKGTEPERKLRNKHSLREREALEDEEMKRWPIRGSGAVRRSDSTGYCDSKGII